MKLRLLVLAAVAVLLTGCGSVHPGAAAVVDGTEISMAEADDVASTYCTLSLLSAQGGAPVPNADVRRQAVTDLVVGIVADDLAERAGVTPNPTSYEVTAAQREQIAESFSASELDNAVRTINASQRTFAIAEQLGARELGDPSAGTQQKQERGFQLIQAELEKRDIEFDPRFGIDGTLQQVAPTGSLSVPASDDAEPQELPATQQCAA